MNNLLALAAALIGTAIVTTGVLILISRFRRGRNIGGASRLTHVALGLGIIALGVGLMIVAWQKWPAFQALVNSQRQTIADTPSIAAPQAWPKFDLPDRKIVFLAWGTPSDVDKAMPDEEQNYTKRLAELAKILLARPKQPSQLEIQPLSRVDFNALTENDLKSTNWCGLYDQALLIAVGMGAKRIEGTDGFAPWREPVYELLDCRDGYGLREVRRVDEQLGDRFPYEQALRADLTELVKRYLSETSQN